MMDKIHCRRGKSPQTKGKSANPAPSVQQLSGRRRPDRKPSKQTVEQRLATLSGSFAGKLPERIEEIRAAAEFFTEQPARRLTAAERQRALATLQALAHRLAGSAATFGFPAAGDIARSIEILCGAIEMDGKAPSRRRRQEFSGLVLALKAASELAAGSSPVWPRFAAGILEKKAAAGKTSRTVILVEDDAEQARILETQISHFKYAVRILKDPAELKEALAETPAAAIIMDIIFRDDPTAGLRAIEALRKDGGHVCPIIFLTVRDDFQARLEAVRAGFDAYLVKPVDLNILIDTLNRLTADAPAEPYRVLVVDDDAETAGYHALLLEEAGMQTQVLTEPTWIMDPLTDFRPDVIVLDINMPGCDGIELAAVIRQHSTVLQAPIIFLTAMKGLNHRLMALRSGGDDFLTKPAQPELLIPTVIARADKARLLSSLAEHARVKENEERLRCLLENAADSIIVFAPDGRILDVNGQALKSLGYSRLEMFSLSLADIDSGFSVPAMEDLWRRLAARAVTVEAEYRRKDGTAFPAEARLTRFGFGKQRLMIAVVRDVSERRRMEAELRRAHDELENRVDERTRELRQEIVERKRA
ncbi:MAG TPA: response regulator, partial [Rhodospirillales bacterium]|nr:response regulator [Rhodospirillales bacterium]